MSHIRPKCFMHMNVIHAWWLVIHTPWTIKKYRNGIIISRHVPIINEKTFEKIVGPNVKIAGHIWRVNITERFCVLSSLHLSWKFPLFVARYFKRGLQLNLYQKIAYLLACCCTCLRTVISCFSSEFSARHSRIQSTGGLYKLRYVDRLTFCFVAMSLYCITYSNNSMFIKKTFELMYFGINTSTCTCISIIYI